MSFPIGDVPKLQTNWDLIKKGLSSWKTPREETKPIEPIIKRTVSETRRKETPIPKIQRSSVNLKRDSPEKNPNTISSTNTGYLIINEKIRFILQDTKNFNERIESFSGTSNEDKEYLDIEEVLFYNLTELVQIRTENVKLKQQKLDAILIVQEKIKELDLKLEENIDKAIKRIGYNSDIFVSEGKNKSKTILKNDKRKRLHFQVTKHSIPLPLVDEINKIKTSLKSCSENRPTKKTQNLKSFAKLKIPEDKEEKLNEPKAAQPIKDHQNQNVLKEEITKIKNNLQTFQKNKPNKKSQIKQHLSLLEIPEETSLREKINKKNFKRGGEEESFSKALTQVPKETKAEKDETERVQHQEEETPSTSNLLKLPENTEIIEATLTTTNLPEFSSNLVENRKFNLIRVLSNPFLFQRNSVTNTLKIIQNCLQEAQHQFDNFKNNLNRRELIPLPAIEQRSPLITPEEEESDSDESINDGNTRKHKAIQQERGENVVELVDNRQISALLVQIRLLLFVTVLKLLHTPYELVPILIMAMWLWERQ